MAITTVELALTGFVVIMLVSQLISSKIKAPYTIVLVFIGVGIAAVSTLSSTGTNVLASTVQEGISPMRDLYSSLVQGGLFVGLVVPPLIFEAMMQIKSEDLRAVIRPAIVLATVGVVIATVVGGLVLFELTGLSLVISLLLAAIIAPTDVVTVLEVFRRSKVPSRLSTLMDTEAAFNDATAIVVFSIVLSSIGLPKLPFLSAFLQFSYSILGGAVIGFVVAFGARKITAGVKDRIGEIVLTIAAVYGSYVFASGLGVSGLISVAVVGLYFGNVTMKKSVRPEAGETVSTFWQLAAFISNSVAFLLIGFETNLFSFYQYFLLIAGAYLAVTVARAASVYPILAIFSQTGTKLPFSWSNVAMLGGVRGALSIALAASLSGSSLVTPSNVTAITTMVLGVAFVSIVLQAPLLSRYVKRKFENQTTLT